MSENSMNENRMISKYSLFITGDLVYLESWLQDMAASGYIAKRIGRLRTEFEISEPSVMRFRVVPRVRAEMSDDEIEMFESSGWHLIDAGGSAAREWAVICTDDEDAPEPFTDEDSYERYIRKTRRDTAINVCLTIAVAAGYLYYFLRGSLGNDSSDLVYAVPGRAFIALGLAALCVAVSWGFDAARYIHSLRSLSRGLQANHEVEYRRFSRVIRAVHALRIVLLAATIVMLAVVLVQEELYSPRSVQESLKVNTGQMVGIQNFDPEAWEKGLDLLPGSPPSSEDYDFEYEYGREYASYRVEDEGRWSMPTELYQEFSIYQVQYDEENQDDREEYSVWYSERIMELRSDKQAEEYLNSEIEHEYEFVTGERVPESFANDIEFECDGTDYAGFYDCGKLDTSKLEADGYRLSTKPQTLYLRRGKWIIEVQYQGDTHLRDSIGLYTDKLLELSQSNQQ